MGILSWANLYAIEVGGNIKHHSKVIGHQWYWEYEYFVDYNTYNKPFSSLFRYLGLIVERNNEVNDESSRLGGSNPSLWV